MARCIFIPSRASVCVRAVLLPLGGMSCCISRHAGVRQWRDSRYASAEILAKDCPSGSFNRFIEVGDVGNSTLRLAWTLRLNWTRDAPVGRFDGETPVRPSPPPSSQIVYETEELMMVNKPAGVPSHAMVDNFGENMLAGLRYTVVCLSPPSSVSDTREQQHLRQ